MTSASPDQRPGWLRRLGTYCRRHRRDLYLAFGAAIGGALVSAAVPLVIRHVIDDVSSDAGHPVDRERLHRANAAWQWRRMMHFPKPTIAMVDGWCFGGAYGPLFSVGSKSAGRGRPAPPVSGKRRLSGNAQLRVPSLTFP